MTLYEEIYYNMPNLSKFYRFEGYTSYPRFSIENNLNIENMLNYIYFSGTQKHHMYYVAKRLRQLISNEILKDTDLKFNKKTLLDSGSFNEIVKYIESFSSDYKMLSIEFSVSPLINQLIDKNYISNRRKQENDRRIERVDYNTYKGGYGLCEEWLRIFRLLTFFQSYRRITNDNLLDFLYMQRRNLIESKAIFNSVSFLLDPKNLVVKPNDSIYSDFSKYELMDTLQKIAEDGLYFPESILAIDQDEQIRRIIQEYNLEREFFLTLSNSIYQRNLSKKLTNR